MHEPAVFRHLAIPVSVFDRIKTVQRSLEAATGQHITLIQTIAAIVREHQQNEERGAHDQSRKQPAALLKP